MPLNLNLTRPLLFAAATATALLPENPQYQSVDSDIYVEPQIRRFAGPQIPGVSKYLQGVWMRSMERYEGSMGVPGAGGARQVLSADKPWLNTAQNSPLIHRYKAIDFKAP